MRERPEAGNGQAGTPGKREPAAGPVPPARAEQPGGWNSRAGRIKRGLERRGSTGAGDAGTALEPPASAGNHGRGGQRRHHRARAAPRPGTGGTAPAGPFAFTSAPGAYWKPGTLTTVTSAPPT